MAKTGSFFLQNQKIYVMLCSMANIELAQHKNAKKDIAFPMAFTANHIKQIVS